MSRTGEDLGRILGTLLDAFYDEPDEVRMMAVLNCLRECDVIPEAAGQAGSQAERWVKVFSDRGRASSDECLGEPIPFRELLCEAASDAVVSGVVIDPHTRPFRIPRSFFELLFR